MKHNTRQRFGLSVSAWQKLDINTADEMRVGEAIDAAISDQAFISVIAPRGTGKTHALRKAIKSHREVLVVEPLRLTREKLHIGDIETAIVRDLSDERPRRSAEARSHQVRQILGEVSQDSRIVLVIDDAHVLHHSTLRALKRLRELAWLGQAPLLGVVLVGQFDNAANIAEVNLRMDRLHLSGLGKSEIKQSLKVVLGSSIDSQAIDLIAGSSQASNWLDLQALIDQCIADEITTGNKTITVQTVERVFGVAKKTRTTQASDADIEQALNKRDAA